MCRHWLRNGNADNFFNLHVYQNKRNWLRDSWRLCFVVSFPVLKREPSAVLRCSCQALPALEGERQAGADYPLSLRDR